MDAYVVEITDFNDGTKRKLGIYTFEDRNSAIASFHKKHGAAMDASNVERELTLVILADGSVIKDELFVREKNEEV